MGTTRKIFFSLSFFIFPICAFADQGLSEIRRLNVRIFYPGFEVRKPYRETQANNLGFDVIYDFGFSKKWGLSFGLGAFFNPIEDTLRARRTRLINAHLQVGTYVRPFSWRFLNPQIRALANYILADSGVTSFKNAASAGGRLDLEIFKSHELFQDSALAFMGSTSASYFFNHYGFVRRLHWDVGLGITGSF